MPPPQFGNAPVDGGGTPRLRSVDVEAAEARARIGARLDAEAQARGVSNRAAQAAQRGTSGRQTPLEAARTPSINAAPPVGPEQNPPAYTSPYGDLLDLVDPPPALSRLTLSFPVIEAKKPLGFRTVNGVGVILTLEVRAVAQVKSVQAVLPGSKVAMDLESRRTKLGQTIKTELVDIELEVNDDASAAIKFKGERHETKAGLAPPTRMQFTSSFDSAFPVAPDAIANVKSSYTVTADLVAKTPDAQPVLDTTWDSLGRLLEAGAATESLRRFVDWAVSTGRQPVPAIPVLPLTVDPRLLDPDILNPGRDRYGPT